MQKIVMRWIKGDEKVNCAARETTLGCGFLVLDRDGNGTIDNGGELFGDQTLVNGERAFSGFAALTGEALARHSRPDWEPSSSFGILRVNNLNFKNEKAV